MQVKCFKPIVDKECKVLILGSVPSVISRKVNFYYGNPSNRFWKILSAILGTDFTKMTNEEKTAELLKRHIALYDVFSSCEIKGSLDSDIKNGIINDIPSLICGTNIKTIYITSKKAFDSFVKRYKKHFESIGVSVINLPSTSGANRSRFKTDDALLNEWQKLFTV
ncbi:MAG: DNA-deoxyinosine glycosylase [Clostridia bacterium]|nr:DNA-deoxyinosine glycosylase [Clostridia bacterium]